jgi:hypothetical protein
MRWAEHVARIGREGMHIEYWWESQAGKGLQGRPRRRWGNKIKLILER